MVRLRAAVAALALFAVSSLAATAVERMVASLHADVPPGWPSNGCLGSAVAPMGAHVVVGQASLCIADGGMHATLDAVNLAPMASYVEWIAYFESPSLCSFGALIYQVYNFSQPCTLGDLAGSQPHGSARAVADSTADDQGDLHLDSPIPELSLSSHAQAWLLVSRPAWTPASHRSDVLERDDTSEPVARATFDVP